MKKSNNPPKINASSMADIAFLLLIFFLVTTTVDQDKGIFVKLPQWNPDIPIGTINDRNVLEILINKNNDLLVEGEIGSISNLKEVAVKFLDNNRTGECNYCKGSKLLDSSDHPTKAIISLLSDRATQYETYIYVYNELISAYSELRDQSSIQLYNRPFTLLTIEEKNKIKRLYPMLISEADITI